MIRKALYLSLFFWSLAGFGDGVVTISGRLTTNTEKECALETKDRIYYFAKKSLSAEQLAQLKPGRKLVALTVPFSSIERIQAK